MSENKPILLTLDFETAYGKHPETGENITLSSMTNEEYVRHKDFKVHGVGIKVNDRPGKYIYGDNKIRAALGIIPWERINLLCQNAHFDGSILSWIYGYVPKFYLDTKSMFRAVYPHQKASLYNICKVLNIGQKGTELENTKGKWELTDEEQQRLGVYCATGKDSDCELTWRAFQKLKKGYPVPELQLIDQTVRMFTQPVFELDTPMLLAAHEEELLRKQAILDGVGKDKKQLNSANKFAELLIERGATPPTKISARTGKLTYAFAKSDEDFLAMLDHPNPEVAALVEARLNTKSSIIETRTKRFFEIGTRGMLPIYLNYYGAHTGRWSGGDKQNPQNMNRGSVLRNAIMAPEGHTVVVCDLSQIEARMLSYWAGQDDMVETFRRGEDPYNLMAGRIYGRTVDRKNNPDDELAGFVGKAVVLGCGYGLGWVKFQEMIRVGMLGHEGVLFDGTTADALSVNVEQFLAKKMFNKSYATLVEETLPKYMDYNEHVLHCACAEKIISTFRSTNPAVVSLWREMNSAIPYIRDGLIAGCGHVKLVSTCKGGILMPNGMQVKYDALKWDEEDREWTTLKRGKGAKRERTRLYGGKVVENVVQALCRNILAEQALQLRKEGLWIATTTHDEIVGVCRNEDAPTWYNRMVQVMSTPPSWAPGFPIAAEGGVNQRYGQAK